MPRIRRYVIVGDEQKEFLEGMCKRGGYHLNHLLAELVEEYFKDPSGEITDSRRDGSIYSFSLLTETWDKITEMAKERGVSVDVILHGIVENRIRDRQDV